MSDDPVQEALLYARRYWQFGREAKTQQVLKVLSAEVERLQARRPPVNANDPEAVAARVRDIENGVPDELDAYERHLSQETWSEVRTVQSSLDGITWTDGINPMHDFTRAVTPDGKTVWQAESLTRQRTPLIECPHWSPGQITLRRGCTACQAEREERERRQGIRDAEQSDHGGWEDH